MLTFMMFIFMIPLITTLNFIINQKHMLMSLLSLEGIMLSLVFLVPISMSMNNSINPMTSIVLLTLGACEASVGLSLMVMMSRSYGNDLVTSMTMMKC